MTKHTPGPWELRSHDVGMFVYCGKGYIISGPINERPDGDNGSLIAAAPELLAAQTMGAQVNTPDFLDWMAERLVHVYGESPNIDFVLSLRDRAAAGRKAIAKALGQSSPRIGELS